MNGLSPLLFNNSRFVDIVSSKTCGQLRQMPILSIAEPVVNSGRCPGRLKHEKLFTMSVTKPMVLSGRCANCLFSNLCSAQADVQFVYR